ncbi:MAG: LysM peptidoglycan-binding domain-containing protein, partial [Acidimicrobiales bacterium]|nr:LysM peptidoglycan-binding domain-containing protein [Acidimicrobiales bacterium]
MTVRAGDSLSLLSLQYEVSVSAIMAVNGITNPDLLYMGQELVIPGVGPSAATTSVVVTVEWGDSLSAIATDYGVSVASLMEANGIGDANAIFAGQELVVPGVSGPLLPAGPVVVTVTSGDTLSEIAEKYGVGLSALMNANALANPDTIYIGQKLTIPGIGPPPTTPLPP